MPQLGINWGLHPTNYKYEVPKEYEMAVKAQQQAALQAARARRSSGGLSELMAMMKVMNAMDKFAGGTSGGSRRHIGVKEQAKQEAADRMAQAQTALFGDANFQERFVKAQTLSAQKAVDELAGINRDIISRYADQYDVDADKLSKVMMGGLQARTNQRLKDVQSSRGDYGIDSAIQGAKRFYRAISRLWNTDAEAEADVKKTIEEQIAFERNNAYARDQALRAQEGEGAWSRAEGWGILANSAGAVGNMLPQIAGTLASRGAGGLIGGAIGSFVGPEGTAAGAQIGSLVGTMLGGGVTAGAQGRFDFVERVLSDPKLTPEQKEEALKGWGITGATALNAALGTIPFGARDVSRMVAPRLAFTKAGKDVAARTEQLMAQQSATGLTRETARNMALGEAARKGLMQEAKAPLLSRAGESFKYSVPEVGAMLGLGVTGNNAIYGATTGQDIPLTEGLQEAAVSGIPMVGLVTAMGAARRMSPGRIPNRWREDGSIKPEIATYRSILDKQVADKNFGGDATKEVISRFRNDWKTDESFEALTKGMEPAQVEVLRQLRNAGIEPRQQEAGAAARIAKAAGTDRFDAAAAEKKMNDAAGGKKPTAAKSDYDAMMQWYRSKAPEWSELEKSNPTVAKEVVRIANRQGELHPDVQNIAERIQRNDGTVTKKSILDWLNTFKDTEELNRARTDLINVLNDGLNTKKDLSNRSYTTAPLAEPGYWKGLLNEVRGGEMKGKRVAPANVQAAISKLPANEAQQPTTNIAAKPNLQNPTEQVPTGDLAANAQQMMDNQPQGDATPPPFTVSEEQAPVFADVNYGEVPVTREELVSAIRRRYDEMNPELREDMLNDEIDFRSARNTEQMELDQLISEKGEGSPEVLQRQELYAIDAEAEFSSSVDALVTKALDNNWYGNPEEASSIITMVKSSLGDGETLPQAEAEIARIVEERAGRTVAEEAPIVEEAPVVEEPILPGENRVKDADAFDEEFQRIRDARSRAATELRKNAEFDEEFQRIAQEKKRVADNLRADAEFDEEFQAGLKARADEATKLAQQKRQAEKEAADAQFDAEFQAGLEARAAEATRLAKEREAQDAAKAQKAKQLLQALAARKQALKNQGANDGNGQRLDGNDAAGAKADDTGITDANQSVEAATANSSKQPATKNTNAAKRGGQPTKGGGTRRAAPQDERKDKASFSNPKQEGSEPQLEGTNAGRNLEIPADDYAERGNGKGGPASKDSGGPNEPKPQESNSGEQPTDGPSIEPRAPLPEMPAPKEGKSISFENATAKMTKLSHKQLLELLKNVPKYMQWRSPDWDSPQPKAKKQWMYGLELATREGQRKPVSPEEQVKIDNERAALLRNDFLEALYAVKENREPSESQKYIIANFESKYGTIEYPQESMLGLIRTYRNKLDAEKRAARKAPKSFKDAVALHKKEADAALELTERTKELEDLINKEKQKGDAADTEALNKYLEEYSNLRDERISNTPPSDENLFAQMLADKKFMKDYKAGKVVPEHIPTRAELREADRAAAQASADRLAAMKNPHIVLDGEIMRVDTPQSAYNAIVNLAARDRSAFESASGSPLSKNNKKMVKNIAYDSLAALYNASVDPAAMTDIQKEMWYAMYNQGFRPLRLDRRVTEGIKRMADKYRADGYDKMTDADYFADTFMTQQNFDDVFGFNNIPC